MAKLKNKWIGRMCLWAVMLFLLLTATTGALAGTGPEDTVSEFRQLMLHSVAYYEAVSGPPGVDAEGEKYNSTLEKTLRSLTDSQLQEMARKHLASVIKRKQQGEALTWDQEFVEKVVKVYLPDLYPDIAHQMAKDSEFGFPVTDFAGTSVEPAYIPGSKTKDYVVYGKHWIGYKLWGFWCRMHWAWDSTKITSVLPSTWGEAYDPAWVYDGIVANQQYYINPQTFHKWVKGRFHNYVPQYRYPWHEITVYAGGTDSWQSGIDGGL